MLSMYQSLVFRVCFSLLALGGLSSCVQTTMDTNLAPPPAGGMTVAAEQSMHEGKTKSELDQYLLAKDEPTRLDAWWSFFQDPVLSELVDSGLAMNEERSLSREDIEFPEDFNTTKLKPYFFDPQIQVINALALTYIDYRYEEEQLDILRRYRSSLKYFINDKEVYRGLYDTLDKESTQHIKRLAELSQTLARLTKLLPQYVDEILRQKSGMPIADITPVLVAPTSTLGRSPQLLLARSLLNSSVRSDLTQESREIFPDIMLGSFFGVPDSAIANDDGIWRVEMGSALRKLNLSSLQSRYSMQPGFMKFRTDLYSYLSSLERLVISYAQMQKQYKVLRKRVDIQKKSHPENMTEYNKNYEAQKAALRARYEELKLLLDIYGQLGVY